MSKTSYSKHKSSTMLQFVINFALPIIILTRFSSESQLGAVNSMLLALAFPVAFEIYNVYKWRKVSLVSITAIVGILVTGAISLLGLSEGWLAIRRSVPYLAFSLAILISMQVKRPIINILLPRIIDMEKVYEAATKKRMQSELSRSIVQASYLISIIFLILGASSYILTRLVITAHTGTSDFNEEYARLRILSIPFISLPLMVGIVSVTTFLLAKIEKVTGYQPIDLLKKQK